VSLVIILIGIFVGLLILAVTGAFRPWRGCPKEVKVSSTLIVGEAHETLFVLVHGFKSDPEKIWSSVSPSLRPFGDVLRISYPGGALSNADPEIIARKISSQIQSEFAKGAYRRVTLIGHSMGALIARKAFLYGVSGTSDPNGEPPFDSWGAKVGRIVLLAGTNRGWDISGQKPSDMGWDTFIYYWAGTWIGRMTGTGELILSMETGAPFVADLRLEWLRWFRRSRDVEVVQLLGDIDDVVSDEDNKDLQAAGSGKFAWLKVRGTGHVDILDMKDESTGIWADGKSIGDYRRTKFLLAVNAPFTKVMEENEEQPFQPDTEVTHVVFVLHGIRDLGRWSAEFERMLLARFRERGDSADGKLVVASIRYGYFGMGPFLLRPDRQKHVRWFMDKYTETLARYPKAREIDFFGHSNGTYLLASALERYPSMKVDRVVFAGSVVPKAYNWSTIVSRGQVQAVRNYVASDDSVVALFPRLFEYPILRVFGNDIGSAGFNGFSACDDQSSALPVQNVEFITGGHSAFRRWVSSIVDFLLPLEGKPEPLDPPQSRGKWVVLKAFSDYGAWTVWLGLASLVLWVGARLATSADRLAWPVVLAYGALVSLLLAWA